MAWWWIGYGGKEKELSGKISRFLAYSKEIHLIWYSFKMQYYAALEVIFAKCWGHENVPLRSQIVGNVTDCWTQLLYSATYHCIPAEAKLTTGCFQPITKGGRDTRQAHSWSCRTLKEVTVAQGPRPPCPALLRAAVQSEGFQLSSPPPLLSSLLSLTECYSHTFLACLS